MIRKNEETKNIKTSFKKFSDMNKTEKPTSSGVSRDILPDEDSDLPGNPNLPKGSTKRENIKISKNSIWYLIIEKNENDLQLVKYNNKKGVDLSKFVNELKSYYKSKYIKNPKVIKLIEAIEIDGNDKYSWIKGIPLIELNGKKMVTKITEDLIRLLSK